PRRRRAGPGRGPSPRRPRGPPRSPPRRAGAAGPASPQLLSEDLVDEGGVRPAAGGLHHLADEPAEGGRLAGPVLRDLRGVRSDDLLDDGGDGPFVRDLDEPLRGHDLAARAAPLEPLLATRLR